MLAAASIKVMDALFGLCEMMQNAVNESFWDAHGVEIGACANFDLQMLFLGTGKNYGDWMLGVNCQKRQ